MIDLCGVTLEHPVLNASGTLDAIAADGALGDATLGAAAHVTKTILAEPRTGNPPPRIAEAPAGMLNSIGLPGPGIDAFCTEILPRTAALCGTTPIVVSIGGFTPDEYVALAHRLDHEPAVRMLELNLSCPNVHTGCISIGTDPDEYARDFGTIMQLMKDSTPDAEPQIRIVIDDVRAYEEGDVGWSDATGRFEHDGTSVAVRITDVVRREDGVWRSVQTHASIGVPTAHMFEPMFTAATIGS